MIFGTVHPTDYVGDVRHGFEPAVGAPRSGRGGNRGLLATSGLDGSTGKRHFGP
jgi:hypothetical protein